MTNRVTIVMKPDNAEKLRTIQAKMIKTRSSSVSFSYIINMVLEEGLKKFKL